jgi:hypothetical protein
VICSLPVYASHSSHPACGHGNTTNAKTSLVPKPKSLTAVEMVFLQTSVGVGELESLPVSIESLQLPCEHLSFADVTHVLVADLNPLRSWEASDSLEGCCIVHFGAANILLETHTDTQTDRQTDTHTHTPSGAALLLCLCRFSRASLRDTDFPLL